jgi:hypothetical protein
MRFVLVKVKDERTARYHGWFLWRATCPPIDIFFWEINEEYARAYIMRKYPGASFYKLMRIDTADVDSAQ